MLTRGVAVVEIVLSDCPEPCAISNPAGISNKAPTAFAPLLMRELFILSTVLGFLLQLPTAILQGRCKNFRLLGISLHQVIAHKGIVRVLLERIKTFLNRIVQ